MTKPENPTTLLFNVGGKESKRLLIKSKGVQICSLAEIYLNERFDELEKKNLHTPGNVLNGFVEFIKEDKDLAKCIKIVDKKSPNIPDSGINIHAKPVYTKEELKALGSSTHTKIKEVE